MRSEQGCAHISEALRGGTELLSRLPPGKEPPPDAAQDEGTYVDVDSSGERDRKQMTELIHSGGYGTGRITETIQELETETETEGTKNYDCEGKVKEAPYNQQLSAASPCCGAVSQQDSRRGVGDKDEDGSLDSGDRYWIGRSESADYEEEDRVNLVFCDECIPCVTEDESHYITTHEIQLSELSDHDTDCDLGVGSSSSWDMEDNQVYSFVDYAACSSGDAGGMGSEEPRSGTGQIHLSITATSRAINDPGGVQERGEILCPASSSGDMSRCLWRGLEAETLRDGAKCFIAVPGRVHCGRKLRGKEVSSSGASSAVSELDDADQEVRSLTAKAFRSLAQPYLDAIHFSTSSESSASEHGLGINRWSAFMYGNMNVDKSVVSHQNSIEIAKNVENRGYKGVALANIKAPSSKMFTLGGSPHTAAASTQKIALMGKFSQGHSGMIRLTETLNFRCNVNSGMSEREMRTNFAQNAAGSSSIDEVTNTFSGGQRRVASHPSCRSMEDTHKKAIFASSLIKNVISKKMQFEQERKMERGEISEPHHPSCSELLRHSSRFSETSSEQALLSLEDLGDIVDSGSTETRSDSRRQDAPAARTNLEPRDEAGNDTKKGTLEASKSTLLRSQNSAFRCWKDGELEFQKDHKNHQSHEANLITAKDKEGDGDQSASCSSKLTKMSHLFVPSIQLLSTDGEDGQLLHSTDLSACREQAGIRLRSDNTLYIADSKSGATSKSPEIKINLRSVRNNQREPFGVSKVRAPNIGCNTANLIRTDDLKCQALAAALKGESDKVPHFMVRDIRDNKGKLQTPIHQVRDVRKLVKSSYHFVSLDNENKSNSASSDSHSEQKKQIPYRNPNSVSPIIIKCQSVNTNNNGKLAELSNHESFDIDGSSADGAKSASLHKTAGNAPIGNSQNSAEGDIGMRKRQEKTSDIADKKPESKIANQMALEKLQAAVKTMEQLYVFERNEWKRKNEPQPLTDSQVLSLIAREEHAGPEEDAAKRSNTTPPVGVENHTPSSDSLMRREDKLFQAAISTQAATGTTGNTGNRNTLSLNSSPKVSTAAKTPQPNTVSQAPFITKSFVPKSPKLPLSLKNNQTKLGGYEGAEYKDMERSVQEFSNTAADNENYLTIPVKAHASSNTQASSSAKTSVYTFSTQAHPTKLSGPLGSCSRVQEDHNQASPKRSSIVMETHSPEMPSAAIYHSVPLGMVTNQPQVYCFSPSITPAPTLEPFQATQKKMLLDPTTGNYYLVDTPVQPATKRLFDPETGQYVDVPIPQPPMTPLPMSVSPMALSPGAYGHTYMIYPGFMPAPSMIPARTLVQSQISVQSEAEGIEKASQQQTEGIYMESPFYMATGKSPGTGFGAPQQATSAPGRTLHGLSTVKQPVISITSQQGPRIIAPPSFDGTTMSFVVEHR